MYRDDRSHCGLIAISHLSFADINSFLFVVPLITWTAYQFRSHKPIFIVLADNIWCGVIAESQLIQQLPDGLVQL